MTDANHHVLEHPARNQQSQLRRPGEREIRIRGLGSCRMLVHRTRHVTP